jgi:hypothetical protein
MAGGIVSEGPAVTEYAVMFVAFAVLSALGFGFIVSMILAGVAAWYVRSRIDPRGTGHRIG